MSKSLDLTKTGFQDAIDVGGGKMNWNSASEFFAMGGYGLYVWGSYGVSVLAIAIELWSLRARRARAAGLARGEA